MEQELVKSCIKGDRKAQERLYRTHARLMYSICLAYTKDEEEAKDVLQDGFIKVFRNLKKYNNQGSLKAWIRKIVINAAIDHLRKRKPLSNFIAIEAIQESEYRDETIPESMKTDEIIKQVRKLPEGARTIFNLFALEGFTHKEIAEKLSITVGTSKSQFSRAKTLLQTWLNDYND